MTTLTKKQQSFVNVFSGDIVQTMRALEYKGTDAELHAKGRHMMENENVRKALQSRYQYQQKQEKLMANRDELMEWWTNIVRNNDPHAKEVADKYGRKSIPPLDIKDRLKASEFLGRAHIMFGEKKEISHNVTITNIIEEAYKVDAKDIKEIEEMEDAIEVVQKELPMPELKDDSTKNDDILGGKDEVWRWL